MRRGETCVTVGLALVLLGAAAAGCGASTSAEEATTASPRTETARTLRVSPGTMSLVVYRLSSGRLRPERVRVPRTTAVAAAALRELHVAAPVIVAGGTAHVDRNDSTSGEIAEIVYTLTRFPTILRVDIGGRRSLTRDDVADFAAPIMIDSPVSGDVFDGTVTGTASVFEATLVVELHQNGEVLATRPVTASEGAPARGTFATQIDASDGTPGAGATIVAYSPSAADGSQQHRVDVRVTLR